jgi:GT2 family glycosyltransferase
VATVIATYDRVALLREALEAQRAQTRKADAVIVVDNASSDETPQVLRDEFPEVVVVRLDPNRGSSGAYSAGLVEAYRRGFDWFWLLDDDAFPEPDALAEIMAATEIETDGRRPEILVGRVEWSDGQLHPMNLPRPNRRTDLLFRASEQGVVPIRSASWIAMLIARSAIAEHGLPLTEYHYWSEDSEFSARVLREGLGYYVPSSIVEHRSATIGLPIDRGGPNMYFEFRNKLWMLRSGSFRAGEIPLIALEVVADVRRFLADAGWSREALWTAARGVGAGLFRPVPKPAPAP